MKFDSYKIIFLLSVLFTSCNFSDIPETPVLKGVKEPDISLNGEWKISLNPPDEVESFTGDEDYWKKIQVPGEVMAQGFTPMHNASFYYFKVISIPSDYDGSIIKLRFDGVSNYAKVMINGKTAGEHRGGFTSWTCDITELVEPGSNVRLIVEMQDKIDDPSY